MSETKIYSALVQAFVDTNLFPTERTQVENAAFEPPTGQPWSAIYFFPDQKPVVATLGAGGKDEHTGFIQFDINVPTDTGTKQANETYDILKNLFQIGKRLSYSGQEVQITSCGRSQGRVVSGFYRVSVTVYYRAYITRN